MDTEQLVAAVLAGDESGEGPLIDYVHELVDVGEPEIALVTILKCGSHPVAPELLDAIATHVTDSGEYGWRDVLRAVDKARARSSAALTPVP